MHKPKKKKKECGSTSITTTSHSYAHILPLDLFLSYLCRTVGYNSVIFGFRGTLVKLFSSLVAFHLSLVLKFAKHRPRLTCLPSYWSYS